MVSPLIWHTLKAYKDMPKTFVMMVGSAYKNKKTTSNYIMSLSTAFMANIVSMGVLNYIHWIKYAK